MNKGYVKVFRSLQDNIIWQKKEEFCYKAAWIDMILRANHSQKEFVLGATKYICRRGQFWTSKEILKSRWGWSEGKLNRFLKLLEMENMIYVESTNRGTMITLVNYGKFQDFNGQDKELTEGLTEEQTEGLTETNRRIKRGSKQRTNNNVNNDIKNDYKNVKKPAAHSNFFVED